MCVHAGRELVHNGCCNLDEELKASYQQLKAQLDDEKEVQATLIQAMQSCRPKEWVFAELEDKLLVQQATGTALLNNSHQRRSDLINGMQLSAVLTIQLAFTVCLHMYFSAIKSWSGSAVDTAIQEYSNS